MLESPDPASPMQAARHMLRRGSASAMGDAADRDGQHAASRPFADRGLQKSDHVEAIA